MKRKASTNSVKRSAEVSTSFGGGFVRYFVMYSAAADGRLTGRMSMIVDVRVQESHSRLSWRCGMNRPCMRMCRWVCHCLLLAPIFVSSTAIPPWVCFFQNARCRSLRKAFRSLAIVVDSGSSLARSVRVRKRHLVERSAVIVSMM